MFDFFEIDPFFCKKSDPPDTSLIIKKLEKGPRPVESLVEEFGEEEVWTLIDSGIIEVTVDFLASLV